MKLFTSTTPAQDIIGWYGQHTFRTSLLIDHVDLFEAAGGTIRVGRHSTWAVLPTGLACPVVCGEIIQIDTEDGPESGRCGLNVRGEEGACERHAEERQGWLAMDESERCSWEHDREGVS